MKCPMCHREMAIEGEPGGLQLFVGHDIHPNLRARCPASHRTVEETMELVVSNQRRFELGLPPE